jgi:hypothetical protein
VYKKGRITSHTWLTVAEAALARAASMAGIQAQLWGAVVAGVDLVAVQTESLR